MEAITTKPCSEMTDAELADFLEQGAWRTDSSEPDQTATDEAVKRLRQ